VGLCPAGSVNQGIGSSCLPNICSAPGPSNDDCSTAITLTVGAPAISGVTYGSSQDTVGSCTTTAMDVWYKFVSGAAGQYQITIVNTNALGPYNIAGTTYSDCPALTEVVCSGATAPTNIQSFAATAATTYWVRVADFSGQPSPHTIRVEYLPSGSCCIATACTSTLQAACTGTWTSGGVCSPNPCLPAGVCCRGATCTTSITSSAACASSIAGGATAGSAFPTSATCNSGTVSNSPCCYANYNKVNGITVQDIFDFLSDWFASRPYARVGGDGTSGTLSVQNIFDFLSNWFNGGCN
jgi:hypothetical protein